MRNPQETRKLRQRAVLAAIILMLPRSNALAEEDEYLSKLAQSSLEEIMSQEITTLSKKEESISGAAAAVYVISADRIRRSGARSIPEILRGVPGLHVARIDAHRWAVSARGFNGLFANKLLVLIDGRSVYTPLFSGVNWDVEGTLVEDIERIEIIRGPGAALWGANAVNGVINIITKHSADTTGVLLSGGAGSEEEGFGSARYGSAVGDSSSLRAYATGANVDNSRRAGGGDNFDHWRSIRGGMRVDHTGENNDSFLVTADTYIAEEHQEALLPGSQPPFFTTDRRSNTVAGGHLLGRWNKALSRDSELSLQGFFDHREREDVYIDQRIDLFDLELQHRLKPLPTHELVWGFGYRLHDDDIDPGFGRVEPSERTYDVVNAFLQDEVFLNGRELRLIAGSKFEHNSFTGFETQPNVRLVWQPAKEHTFWGSAARAVQLPSRASEDVFLDIAAVPSQEGGAQVLEVVGNHQVDSVNVLALELGYRAKATESLGFDIATFYNIYDDIQNVEPGMALPDRRNPAALMIPLNVRNNLRANTYGVELAVEITLQEWWQLEGSYTFLDIEAYLAPGSRDVFTASVENENPHNMFSLRSFMSFPWGVEVDGTLRYVDNIPQFGIPSYTELDLRLGWKVTSSLELSVLGQNLLDASHVEYVSTFFMTPRAEVERAVLGKVTWKF